MVIIADVSEANKILNATSRNSRMSTSDVVYVAVAAWADTDDERLNSIVPIGSVGLAPYVPTSATATENYLRLWKRLDPLQYPDIGEEPELLSSV